MGDVAVSVIMLVMLIGGWLAIAGAMKQRGRGWLARHLAGMLLANSAALGVLLIGLALGLADSPEGDEGGGFASFIIGALLLAPIVFVHDKLSKSSGTQSPRPEPESPKHTPPPRPKLLTADQSKALNLKEHISERAHQLRDKPPKPSKKANITSEPTRAIRDGWALCSIAFDYEDASGQWTERTVTVHSVSRIHIKGECHARRAERTFRLDRIMSDITDIETGEILDIDEWVDKYI